jgi:hypothetical protein
MRTINLKSAMIKTALAAIVLLSASGGALAQQVVNLTVAPTSTTLSDGNTVPMWGYSCGAAASASTATCTAANPAVAAAQAAVTAGTATDAQSALAATWSPVIITVPSGQGLQINLTNNLNFANGNTVPTSVVIVGQLGGGLGTDATKKPSPDHSTVRSQTWPIANGSTPDASGQAPIQGDRVQSFATEVAAVAAGSATIPPALTWSNLQPGTYLIHSGTHPSIQVPMGLYGILVVTDSTKGIAYPAAGSVAAITYSADIPLVFGEIDPVQNGAVSTAVNTASFDELKVWSGLPGGCGNPGSTSFNTCYPPAVNYSPLYYLINGRTFDITNAAASLFPVNSLSGSTAPVTGNVLVRLVNAGLKMHVPAIVGAQTTVTNTVGGVSTTTQPGGFTLVAEDGNVLPGQARVQNEVFLAAGKTYDVLINTPATVTTALPIYDRELSLSANATGRNGGMLAYIGINGASIPAAALTSSGVPVTAVANTDTYNALIAGQALKITDPAKGVVANDIRVYGVSLLTQASSGTVVLNSNGTFTYTPNAGSTATTDSFTYCANGTVSAGVCSSGVSATVTLGASLALKNDTGITCTATTFSSNVATRLAINTPGVLSGCTDGQGLPVTVDLTTLTPVAGLTIAADANGGFIATAPAAATGSKYTFTFKAKNSVGLFSAATTVTVNFPAPSNLAVTVLDGSDHTTAITDYRWIIEEDRTFFNDPACITNPLPAGCPTLTGGAAGAASSAQINYGTNFHTSSMPLVAAGCTGSNLNDKSCEAGQTLLGKPAVCEVGNGVCSTSSDRQVATFPADVHLDPSKRYYISILPGDAPVPFNNGYTGAPDCSPAGVAAGHCGHGMGGAPIAAACGPQSASKAACPATPAAVTVFAVPTPLPSSTLSVFVYQDDYPLNGEQGSGGGVDVLAPQEAGLGGFQISIFDQAGGTGDATGQAIYDMFNEPLANALAGTIDPVTKLDACPVSTLASAASASNAAGNPAQSTSSGFIVTCPKYESDGKTLSPLAGQALVKYLYPGRYGIAALPGASRIALGEEWVQTNTLDGQKAHDSFMRVAEPGYFQEFGPAGYHVSIGFANPKVINERRYNDSKSGMCDPLPKGGALACTYEVKGKVTGARLSRAPDSRLYSSGSRDSLAFTQCYVALGDPDGAEIAFSKCDADGNFDFQGVPAGNWKVTTLDQWNDQIIDGITQAVSVGCSGNAGGLCTPNGVSNGGTTGNSTCGGPTTSDAVCDMGEIGVHQWQANIYTRSFIDTTGTGVSDDTGTGSTKPGLSLVATNIRFRDGSYSNFNNTDLAGNAGFNEVFPLFNWYAIESDSTRFKTTGVHVIYDAGGPADGSPSCNNTGSPLIAPCGTSQIAAYLANTYERFPLPADLLVPGSVPCTNADCTAEAQAGGVKIGVTRTAAPTGPTPNTTGRIDPPFWFNSYGWQGYIGQGNFLEFGKKPFAPGETGPIHGHVVYASSRPYDDPRLLLQQSWEPLVAHVTVNLYQEGVADDGVTPTLKLVDTTQTTSWDDWVQGFRADGKPNMNCPGQQRETDPFFYALTNQPHYLDWYNAQYNNGTLHTLPYDSQYKCYDGEHTWNQLQPAPYDGMYSFPSVTGLDPITGKPSGTNCKICVTNPSRATPGAGLTAATDPFYDPYRAGTPMLPPGKYVVEVVVPPGYELVKEEDKNILIGDNYIAPAAVQIPGLASAVYILPDQAQLSATYNAQNAQNPTTSLGRNAALPSHEGDTGSDESFWPCVGEVRQVPDYISLFPGSQEVAPFAGAFRPLCDRKEVSLDPQSSVLTKFYVFTSTHLASHFQGIILDDFAAEFDPFSPQFSEKFAPSYLPVGVKDWTGNPINRVYSDQFGLYNGLNYSTWEVNPPNPTGYGPTMMVMCMNDAGTGVTPDPLFQPGYSQFCYELPFMPGQTGYFDTPVVPVQAFSSGSYNRPDCAYPDATPAIASVVGSDGVAGPWVKAGGSTLTITSLGDQSVDWYGYTGPKITDTRFNQAKITRHYGFGGQGSVTIGGVAARVNSWSDTTITVTVPANVPACAVQQQAVYQGTLLPGASPVTRCGQLIITTGVGKKSVDTVTVTVGGKQPTVLQAGQTIQSLIDAAAPGDEIIVPAGVYNEMLVMWKPVRLQGVGAAVAIVDANTQPAAKLLNPWRQKVVCLFGLTTDGRPDDISSPRACVSGLNYASNAEPGTGGFINFPTLVVDRLPLEATLGWDSGLNGNLAEQTIEPSLLGAYEGAAITVIGKGIKFPSGTKILDAFGATTATPAAFPDNSALLSSKDCAVVTVGGKQQTAYPSNFYCNPSSIDGLGIRDSSQGGGGIFVHAYAHNLQIANNRVHNNQGTLSGGITLGAGEHADVLTQGSAAIPTQILTYPASCELDKVGNAANQSLPFCFNVNINVHNNGIVANSSLGDEIFSSTPAGAGGVSINTGADYYQFTNNWVCGNLSSGDGGGVSHIGFIKNGNIANNTIIFNQSTNPTITTNGGGLLVMGAPDADPTNCGVSTDLDCVPTPATILPSDGTGPGLTINANLILGNAADSGSGGGLRIQHVNGTDVLNLPNGQQNCTADLGRGVSNATRKSFCNWNSVNVTNNIIVNNVAGWDGAGVSLLDVLAANIVNNTIASNDATASSGSLFQSLFAPLASSAAPSTNVVCGAGAGSSCPQVAGLVSVSNSPVLQANIGLLPVGTLKCPAGHGVAIAGAQPSCYYNSIPLLVNDALWQNRSFYIGVGGFGGAAANGSTPANTNQQKVVTLYPKGSNTPAGSQTTTGACVTGSSYWDLGYRGDTNATSHATDGFAPINSVVSAATATTYGGTGNLITSPSFTSQYCNGSRTPPELGASGYAVPPGVNEFNAFPNPVFSLTPAGVVDEGNNWVNVRWGPLALTNPATGNVLGNYAPTGTATTSSAIDHGVAVVTVDGQTVASPPVDFFGNGRPANDTYDIGAVEVNGVPRAPELSVTGGPLAFTGVVGYTSAPKTLTVRNTGNLAANINYGLLSFSSAIFSRPSGAAGGTCTTATPLAAGGNCTINVVFTPTTTTPVTGTLTIFADVPVTGSPVTLNGTAVAPVISATLTPTSRTVRQAANCPGTGLFGQLACAGDPIQTFTLTNTGNVTLTGIGQGTLAGANTADFASVSLCGLITTALAPGGTCQIFVQFRPLTAEPLGAKTVTLSVTDSVGTQTAAITGIDAPPVLTSVAPASGMRGTTVPVTLTGNFLFGANAVTVSGGGVNCAISPAGQTSLTSLTANCTIAAGATLSSRNVTVATSLGTSNAAAFTVTGATVAIGAPAPVLTTTPADTTTKTGTVTVSNAGASTAPLTLTANPTIAKVGTAGGTFSIQGGGTCVSGAVVSPGSSCTINVQYVPGASTATATANVTITGSGLAAATLTSANFSAN